MIKATSFGNITRFDLSRTILGREVYRTTAYYVDGLMIDTGSAHSANELLDHLNSMPMHMIINTHSHEDHIGANKTIQKHFPGIPIFAHPLAVEYIQDPAHNLKLHLYRRIVWGSPGPSVVKPVRNDQLIVSGKYRFQVIFTPGHTDDHICLYEPDQQWIFTGDLYVGGRDRAIRAGSNIWQIIESLKKISSLPLKGMYPNSARVRLDPINELNRKISYLEMVGEKILTLSDQGWSESKISREIFGNAMLIEMITLGHLSRRNLVRSYLYNKPG